MREDGATQSHPPGVFKRKRTLRDQDHETAGSCFIKIVTYYRAEKGMTGTGPLLGRIRKGGRCLSWVLIDECKILSRIREGYRLRADLVWEVVSSG